MAGLINKRVNLHQQLQDNRYRIQALEQEIQATQKLASLGTIACLAAHEFKNFLVPIINWAELSLKNPEDNELAQKALRKAIQQGNLASEIIHRMLGFARQQSTVPEDISFTELVNNCFLCLARDFAKDNITVIKEIPPDLSFQAYPSQIQQVLLNLLINARHAMLERGGTLTIIAQTNDDQTVTFVVKDTGCGIPSDVIEHIFEPFFSTKAENPAAGELRGNGLGLAVCKDIIEAHQGSISVQSQPGQGTTFTINLPSQCQTQPDAT
ncbi:MAG: HAMP domain-containing histidine kinase [Sedimentisphaerales bacterium]|nr:HAMP domain-containing histidine kinase [Sedimentisphaerales bacterium]